MRISQANCINLLAGPTAMSEPGHAYANDPFMAPVGASSQAASSLDPGMDYMLNMYEDVDGGRLGP